MISIQEEDNHLMRFANSGISLNTSEHLITIDITGYLGKKKASTTLLTDLSKFEMIKEAIDNLKVAIEVSEELSYLPSIPKYEKDIIIENSYDEDLKNISNEEKLSYFNKVSEGMESEDVKVSGNFLNGNSILTIMTTESEFYYMFKETDAQMLVVLSSEKYKWEINTEASAQKKSDINIEKAHNELKFLFDVYKDNKGIELAIGEYDVIFGTAATAEILNTMSFQLMGDAYKRGYGYVSEKQIGEKVLSEKFSLRENPNLVETFPMTTDLFGIERGVTDLFDKGVFKSFLWSQEAADEFNEKSTGHSINRLSIEMLPGDVKINCLEDIKNMEKERDILYIPYIHYMNIVNPTEGLITGSSRFGALYFKKDGTVLAPFNVRLTKKYSDFFGESLDWVSKTREVYNLTNTYGLRNPMANMMPKFIKINNLGISSSNKSF